MLGDDDELVETGFRRHDGAGPADREAGGLEPLRVRSFDPEVEVDHGIDALHDEESAIEAPALVVLRPQPTTRVDRGGGATETSDQIGQDGPVLTRREPGEFDPRRP